MPRGPPKVPARTRSHGPRAQDTSSAKELKHHPHERHGIASVKCTADAGDGRLGLKPVAQNFLASPCSGELLPYQRNATTHHRSYTTSFRSAICPSQETTLW